MASKKGKKAQVRTPADKLTLDFISLHDIVLIADEIPVVEGAADNKIYTINKKIRIRAYYKDELDKVFEKTKPTNGEGMKVAK
ncbi:MAG: hypothetical protein ACYSWS_03440 [Planctomycetota bacterium]|jgi:hypothetical protein